MVPFLQKHIRGNPTIVMELWPAGGGRKAANYLYRTARPDGLTIGNPSVGMFANAILGESGVQYDIDKFSYWGARATGADTVVQRNRAWLEMAW